MPEFHAWILSDIAKYASLAGASDHSLELARQAVAAAERSGYWVETWLRRSDLGALLVAAGRPVEALAEIPDPGAFEWPGVHVDPGPSDAYLQAYLAWAEASCAVGNLPEYDGTHLLDLLVAIAVGVLAALPIVAVRRLARWIAGEGERRLGLAAADTVHRRFTWQENARRIVDLVQHSGIRMEVAV